MLYNKGNVNFRIYGVIYWETNDYKKKGNQTLKFGQVTEYNVRNVFL